MPWNWIFHQAGVDACSNPPPSLVALCGRMQVSGSASFSPASVVHPVAGHIVPRCFAPTIIVSRWAERGDVNCRLSGRLETPLCESSSAELFDPY